MTEAFSIEDYIRHVRENYTDEQMQIAMDLKTPEQARQVINNPIMFPLFMTKHIHGLGKLTGHKMRMVDDRFI